MMCIRIELSWHVFCDCIKFCSFQRYWAVPNVAKVCDRQKFVPQITFCFASSQTAQPFNRSGSFINPLLWFLTKKSNCCLYCLHGILKQEIVVDWGQNARTRTHCEEHTKYIGSLTLDKFPHSLFSANQLLRKWTSLGPNIFQNIATITKWKRAFSWSQIAITTYF